MLLHTCAPGSYPPLPVTAAGPSPGPDALARLSIQRTIIDQRDLGLDILGIGQVRDEDDVATLADHLPGLTGAGWPIQVVGKVLPAAKAVWADDFAYARSLAGDQPIKVQLIGPVTLTQCLHPTPESGYRNRNDLLLLRDIAAALAYEARRLVESGAKIIEISEPALTRVADVEPLVGALKHIVTAAEIECCVLQVPGRVTYLLPTLLNVMPVQVIAVAGYWLTEPNLRHIDSSFLAASGRQIGLGAIRTDDFEEEKITRVQNFLDQLVARLGADHIWAVMPTAGMRHMPYELARAKLKVMVEAVQSLEFS